MTEEKKVIKIEIEVSHEDIIDVLITALEGGSNYWHYISNTAFYITKKDPNKTEIELMLDSVLLGKVVVPIYDIESDRILGFLDYNNIIKGIKQFINNGNYFCPDMDASEADTLFQYIVLSDIIFN